MAGAIPNGMLCYTGLTPGSTATYSCDKGYELSGSSVLVCQANGLWNGTGPTCMELGMCHSVTELSVRFPTHSRCWWAECWSSSWYSIWSTYFTPWCSCSSVCSCLLHMGMRDYSNWRWSWTFMDCITWRTSKSSLLSFQLLVSFFTQIFQIRQRINRAQGGVARPHVFEMEETQTQQDEDNMENKEPNSRSITVPVEVFQQVWHLPGQHCAQTY